MKCEKCLAVLLQSRLRAIVCVQEGHFVEARVNAKQPVASADEVKSVFTEFTPLQDIGLKSSPAKPIVVLSEQGRPRPMQDSNHYGGVAVAVGNISVEDQIFHICLTYVVNNLVRGAAGGLLLTAELWERCCAPNRLYRNQANYI